MFDLLFGLEVDSAERVHFTPSTVFPVRENVPSRPFGNPLTAPSSLRLRPTSCCLELKNPQTFRATIVRPTARLHSAQAEILQRKLFIQEDNLPGLLLNLRSQSRDDALPLRPRARRRQRHLSKRDYVHDTEETSERRRNRVDPGGVGTLSPAAKTRRVGIRTRRNGETG